MTFTASEHTGAASKPHVDDADSICWTCSQHVPDRLLSHAELYQHLREKLPKVIYADLPGESASDKTDKPDRDETGPSVVSTDVRLLGALLGLVLVNHRGEAFYQVIEQLRGFSKAARQDAASALTSEEKRRRFDVLDAILQQALSPLCEVEQVQWLQDAASAFRLFLTLTDIAERFHQSRSLQHDEEGFIRLLHESHEAVRLPMLLDALAKEQPIRLVSTAHPTTILRQTLLRHQRDVFHILKQLYHRPLTRVQQQELMAELAEKVEVLWATRFSRWTKPKVIDEVRDVVGYFSRTLYDMLPLFHQHRLSALSIYGVNPSDKLDHPVITLGTWVGGDMDGNPFVNASVFADALFYQFKTVLSLYRRDLLELAPQLSFAAQEVEASDALKASISLDFEHMHHSHLESMPYESSVDTEPHRLKLLLMAERLAQTEHQSFQLDARSRTGFIYTEPQQVIADIELIMASLKEKGYDRSSRVRLKAFIDKVILFGFHGSSLDLREDTANVRVAAKAILKGCGMEMTEQETAEHTIKTLTDEILTAKIVHPRQLESDNLRHLQWAEADVQATERLLDMLRVARQSHRIMGRACCVNFILSMTTSLTDVLSALLLLKTQGLFYKNLEGHYTSDISIVPLFETIPDLARAPDVFEAMLQNPAYRQHLMCRGNEQLIMLGYSDSNKDGGYFCSNWSVYHAQRELLSVAERYGINLKFFHGRGGNIGRGGGPSHRAVQALPPRSCLRGQDITEQGEVLSRYYNVPDIALSHLENIYTAVLQKNLNPEPDPELTWQDAAQQISALSYQRYAELVHHHPDFIAYFEEVTPREVELVNIGSRPARRRTMTTIKDLRAIPWVFRWFQSRQLLPGWFGLGSGLAAFRQSDPEKSLALLRDMYNQWPFFKSLIENSEIALRQTDLSIAHYYCALASDQTKAQAILATIEAEYHITVQQVMTITGQSLLERPEDKPLKHSIELKEPYLDSLNVIQGQLLRRYRQLNKTNASPEALEPFHHAIVSSIEGIATGLGTAG